jgi:hypothetical protein
LPVVVVAGRDPFTHVGGEEPRNDDKATFIELLQSLKPIMLRKLQFHAIIYPATPPPR